MCVADSLRLAVLELAIALSVPMAEPGPALVVSSPVDKSRVALFL
jgi:hypothetical protein